jgi:hypothetical protein
MLLFVLLEFLRGLVNILRAVQMVDVLLEFSTVDKTGHVFLPE